MSGKASMGNTEQRRGRGSPKVVAAGVGAATLVFLAGYLWALGPPDAPPGTVLHMSGTWEAFEGENLTDPSQLAGLEGRSVSMPGVGAVRHGPGHVWLRKSIELTPQMRGKPLFFFMGSDRTSIATLYFNGRRVGRQAASRRGIKFPSYAAAGFSIPVAFQRDGTNILSIRMDYIVAVDAGMADPRNYLGTEEVLLPYFEAYRDVEKVLPAGAIFMFLLLIVILSILWRIESRLGEKNARDRYLTPILILGACLLWVNSLKTTYLVRFLPGPEAVLCLNLVAIALMIMPALDLAEYYRSGGGSWVSRVSRWTGGAYCLAVAIQYAAFSPEAMLESYFVYGAFVTSMMVFVLFRIVAALAGPTGTTQGALALATLSVITGAGIYDFVRELTLHSPAVFPAAMVPFAVLSSAVAISGFLQLSAKNIQLSSNLSLANARLRNALDRAEEATRIKTEFFANVSHELRTPLNAIVNLPRMLLRQFRDGDTYRCLACGALVEREKDEVVTEETACPGCGLRAGFEADGGTRFVGDPGEARADLKMLEKTSDHLLHVVNDILDMSSLEAKSIQIHPEAVDAVTVAEQALGIIRPVALEAGVRLEHALPSEGTVEVLADPLRLTQILVNLLNNAVKFTPRGKKVVLLMTVELRTVLYVVEDEGIGISKENQELIFESFRQVDSGNKRSSTGSGLGLAITRHLVDLHGGKVWVTSDGHEGSRFFVRMPLA
ncbi:MAG: HAMP domain-containing histidine kinase [Myxococcales bacterium]|nr:HAMP domain-containing histidine kinase [Myxococcales bacterium]